MEKEEKKKKKKERPDLHNSASDWRTFRFEKKRFDWQFRNEIQLRPLRLSVFRRNSFHFFFNSSLKDFDDEVNLWFYQVLLGFTGFSERTLSLTGFHWVKQGLTEYNWFSMGFTGFD